ncbi:MAG: FAD-dependent oxidoreductase [Candidatus Hydrogenedentota bacterium]
MSLKIIIIGATAAGTSTAIRTRELYTDAEITIIEKRNYIGLSTCALHYWIGNELKQEVNLTRNSDDFKKQYNLEILLDTEAIEIIRRKKLLVIQNVNTKNKQELRYDYVIIATGSRPVTPPWFNPRISGLFILHSLEDALNIKKYTENDCVKKAVIVGAGSIGIGVTEALLNIGYEVTLVEKTKSVIPAFDIEFSKMFENELIQNKIIIYKDVKNIKILSDGQKIQNVLIDSISIPASLLISSVGYVPEVKIAKKSGITIGENGGIKVNDYLQTNEPNIFACGDCVEKKCAIIGDNLLEFKADTAVIEGRIAAFNLLKPRIKNPASLHNLSIKFRDITLCKTGITEELASNKKQDIITQYAYGSSKARYIHSANPIVLKTITDKESGRLIGAQGFGRDGVDKRINILSALISKKTTTDELALLDLGYTPFLSPVSDIIHLAGHMYSNEKNKLVYFIKPSQFIELLKNKKEEKIVCILKKQKEGLPQNVSNFISVYAEKIKEIPYSEFKIRYKELNKNYRVILIDSNGKNSYLASRILSAKGYRRHTVLNGGYSMLGHFL